jgi:hypothetical protein
MDSQTTADPVDDGETWNFGDIIKDRQGKEWKIVKIGSGETRSHKDADGNLLYDNIGGDMMALQFAEPILRTIEESQERKKMGSD